MRTSRSYINRGEGVLSRARDIMRRQHLSLATEQCYIGWIRRYIVALETIPRDILSEQKVERFLTQLAKIDVAVSTQNQAFNALLWFYAHVLEKPLKSVKALRAKRPARVRIAPARDEVMCLLAAIHDLHGYPTRLIVHLLYGSGLRVSEALNLRVKDVLITRSQLVVRDGKGGKDRVVSLPCALIPALERQLKSARVVWENDVASAVPVPLPGRLAVKYPRAQFSWQWAWLFPSRSTCKHPHTGEIVRYRCHESNVQRAMKAAAQETGIEATPHLMRHAYATHALDAGNRIHDLQKALGHKQVETTLTYLHGNALRVESPLTSTA